MDPILFLPLSLLPALVIAAGLKDLTSMTIPNWISAILVVAFFPAAFLMGLPVMTVAAHLGVALIALFVAAGMFALRWIGGGDAKLTAAACLWLGVSGSGMFLLWTGLMGGLFCLALIFARAQAPALMPVGAPGWVSRLMEPRGDIPYGVAIAAGALMAWPSSPLMNLYAAGV
ncbi:MAG: prepilin peptidase [Alphaproteobacteria bacterium]|nr:prepilin peptidase [Alphaproteobacteria bacterium]MBU1527036.1 prepilin peptidase [Alphaproteobacteria bacterium]MBU2352397.1 prepilin peptidase [Alphaproteobacteria bacterium]MBU2382157.1 prepilin peptidase [Alphaproteobacteria bacterium]